MIFAFDAGKLRPGCPTGPLCTSSQKDRTFFQPELSPLSLWKCYLLQSSTRILMRISGLCLLNVSFLNMICRFSVTAASSNLANFPVSIWSCAARPSLLARYLVNQERCKGTLKSFSQPMTRLVARSHACRRSRGCVPTFYRHVSPCDCRKKLYSTARQLLKRGRHATVSIVKLQVILNPKPSALLLFYVACSKILGQFYRCLPFQSRVAAGICQCGLLLLVGCHTDMKTVVLRPSAYYTQILICWVDDVILEICYVFPPTFESTHDSVVQAFCESAACDCPAWRTCPPSVRLKISSAAWVVGLL